MLEFVQQIECKGVERVIRQVLFHETHGIVKQELRHC